jgi:hypothetical protein
VRRLECDALLDCVGCSSVQWTACNGGARNPNSPPAMVLPVRRAGDDSRLVVRLYTYHRVPQLPDVEAKKAARAAYATDTMPRWLALLEQRLGAGPFYGGARYSSHALPPQGTTLTMRIHRR